MNLDNQLNPSFGIHDMQMKEKEQKPFTWYKAPSSRKNNRKRTRGRKTQYVAAYDFSTWPPKIFRKCIKHVRS